MEEKKFKNIQELLDFVLKECSDINFTLEVDIKLERRDGTRWELIIHKPNINFERIYFAQILLEKQKLGTINQLTIEGFDSLFDDERDNGFLSKLDIKKLDVYINNAKIIPELPKKLKILSVYIHSSISFPKLPNLKHLVIGGQGLDVDNFPKLPNSLEIIEIKTSPFKEKFQNFLINIGKRSREREIGQGQRQWELYYNSEGKEEISLIKQFMRNSKTENFISKHISKFKQFINGR